MPVSNVDRKLSRSRAKKAQTKSMISKCIGKRYEKNENQGEDIEIQENLLNEESDRTTQKKDTHLEMTPSDEQSDENLEEDSLSLYDYTYYTLWFILWVTVYAIFIQIEFGIVYLILSGLLGIFLNTRTRPKKENEISAYSVFNKNCESIDGTLKGEQLTREMLYGGFR